MSYEMCAEIIYGQNQCTIRTLTCWSTIPGILGKVPLKFLSKVIDCKMSVVPGMPRTSHSVRAVGDRMKIQ